MEISQLIESLPSSHQAAFCGLNCEKMLPSIVRFDEDEPEATADLFRKAITFIYNYAISPPVNLDEYTDLKGQIEALWPDLDESANDFASYAFDAFIATTEALNFVLSGNTVHAANCSAAALDTVDMYIQEVSEADAPALAAELEVFIQASPFMMRENKRQALLLEELAKIPAINLKNIARLRRLNEQEALVDFSVL